MKEISNFILNYMSWIILALIFNVLIFNNGRPIAWILKYQKKKFAVDIWYFIKNYS